jgi:hypothetical protein
MAVRAVGQDNDPLRHGLRQRGGDPHNDKFESSSFGSENDVSCHSQQKRGTTRINKQCGVWLSDPVSKDRAASPVGRGRRGEGQPETREQTDVSIRGRQEAGQ